MILQLHVISCSVFSFDWLSIKEATIAKIARNCSDKVHRFCLFIWNMRSGQRAAPIQLYSHAPTDTFLEEKLASPKILFGPDTAIVRFVHKIGIIGNSGEREIGQNLRNWTGRSWMSLWMTTVFGLRVLSLFAFILSVNCSYSSAPLSWVLTVIKWWQSWRWWSKARRKLIMVMVMIMVMMI